MSKKKTGGTTYSSPGEARVAYEAHAKRGEIAAIIEVETTAGATVYALTSYDMATIINLCGCGPTGRGKPRIDLASMGWRRLVREVANLGDERAAAADLDMLLGTDAATSLEEDVPGINALANASRKWGDYRAAQRSYIAADGLGRRPVAPAENYAELVVKFPRAAAYRRAKDWEEYSSHYVKSSAGRDAARLIREGADIAETLSEMDKVWTDYCLAAAWD